VQANKRRTLIFNIKERNWTKVTTAVIDVKSQSDVYRTTFQNVKINYIMKNIFMHEVLKHAIFFFNFKMLT